MGEVSDRVNLMLGGRRRDPPPPSPPGALPATIEGVEDPTLPISERVRQALRLRAEGIDAPDPVALEAQTREQFLAAQIGQESLPEEGFQSFGVRADLGLSDTFSEKKQKFLSHFPDGDFISVSEPPERLAGTAAEFGRGGATILLRRHPNEPFIELDPPAFEAFGDLADFSGEVPSIIGEAVATRGRTLVRQVLSAMAGNIAGGGVKEAVEELRGFQQETLTEIIRRQGIEAVTVGAGAGLTSVVTGPINVLRGAAPIRLRPGARKAQQAAEDAALPPLMPGQVSANPLVQRLNAQAAALTTNVNQYLARQRRAVVDSLSRLRDKDLSRMLTGPNSELLKLHNEARDQILAASKIQTTSLTKGGQALATGIAEYDNIARATVNRAYDNARALEEPVFNIEPLRAVAEEIKRGVSAVGADGLPIRGSELDTGTARVIDDILAIEDLGEQPMEFLLALRERLWEAKTPNPGEIARRPQKDAAKLYAAINNVFDSVKNTSPEFVDAWRSAGRTARERFETMEKLVVIEASRTETPAKMARRLTQPYEIDNLRTLRGAVTDPHWRVFENAAMSDMISLQNLPDLTRRLASFDKETAEFLFGKGNIEVLRDIGKNFDQLQRLNLPEIIQRQRRAGGVIEALVAQNDASGLNTLLRATGFNPEDPRRKMLRAGIIDNIWDRVVREVDGEVIVRGNDLTKILKEYREKGVTRLLTKEDMDILENLDAYSQILSSSADAGIALIAASTAQSLLHFNRQAILSLMHNISVGRIATSKIGQRVMTGRGVEALPFRNARVVGAILGNVVNDLRAGSTPNQAPQ